MTTSPKPSPKLIKLAEKWLSDGHISGAESKMVRDWNCPSLGTSYNASRIILAALHHERCELGHANDLLDQIQALVDGHGVGLRDAVQDVLAGR